jgi:hypothetical protein
MIDATRTGDSEPRGMTLADLGVMVAGVALVMTVPSPASGFPPILDPQAAVLLFAVSGSFRLTVGFGLVLALVILCRRARYGGPVRPAECLALGLASLGLVDAVPNLDEAVNAYYAAMGASTLDFGVARWLLSAPAAVGVVLIVAGLVVLRRRAPEGLRVASALTVVGIVGGLFLWFWGPCEVARLQLPWLLVPSPPGDSSLWGWRGPVVLALRELVATSPMGLTWGLLFAVTVRARRDDRQRGRARARAWTERAAFADAVVVALVMLAAGGLQGNIDFIQRAAWIVIVGFASWWITGRSLRGAVPLPQSERP